MPDMDNVKDLICQEFLFLHQIGFGDPGKEIIKSELAGDILVVIYQAPQFEREIRISYASSHGDMRESISLSIVNTSNNNSFLLKDWIKIHNINISELLFYNKNGDIFPFFVHKFCIMANSLLLSSLNRTIIGESWEYVPIDWAGFR